jgi:hypothetical protein
MEYIQDILGFYSTGDLVIELIPSFLDIKGFIILILLCFSLILKSFLFNYNASYSERFCLGWSIF